MIASHYQRDIFCLQAFTDNIYCVKTHMYTSSYYNVVQKHPTGCQKYVAEECQLIMFYNKYTHQ